MDICWTKSGQNLDIARTAIIREQQLHKSSPTSDALKGEEGIQSNWCMLSTDSRMLFIVVTEVRARASPEILLNSIQAE